MKMFFVWGSVLWIAAMQPVVRAATVSCPDPATVVQVGACPSDEELKYTFTGYCSDSAKAYKGETDVCTDYQRYRQLKNVALWESADGVFDAYVSCEAPKDALKRARFTSAKVTQQGKLTLLTCSYEPGVNFVYRTRAQCTLANGATQPPSGQANCE
jgi:hypothetical protein